MPSILSLGQLANSQALIVDGDGRPRDYMGNHAAAFQGGSDQPDKGSPAGSCNVRACQRPEAFWRNDNFGSGPKYYCRMCANDLNKANRYEAHWKEVLLDRKVLAEHDAALKAA